LKTVRHPSIDWLSSNSSISNRFDCGEHSSNVVREFLYVFSTTGHTSVSAILHDVEQVPDVHKRGLVDLSRSLDVLASIWGDIRLAYKDGVEQVFRWAVDSEWPDIFVALYAPQQRLAIWYELRDLERGINASARLHDASALQQVVQSQGDSILGDVLGSHGWGVSFR
jgi:hypothetical protein